MKYEVIKKKNSKPSLFFLLMFCALELFAVNTDRFEASEVTRNIKIPYIDMNITVALAIVSFLTIASIVIVYHKIRINDVLVILIMRVPLYFVSMLYLDGDFKWGIAYAIVQCVLSFIIGYNYYGSFSLIVRIVLFLSLAISVEVFLVLIINQVSVFAPDLKWYMVIPVGRSNYIAAILLPMYVMVDLFYAHRINRWLRLAYAVVIGGAVLATGSKFGLVVFVLYLVSESVSYLIGTNKLKKKTAIKGAVFVILVLVILIWAFIYFNSEISSIVLKYLQNNIFENRIKVYSDALSIFLDNPLLGRGAFAYNAFDAVKAHNWFLESLIQTGFLGTVLFCLALFLSMKHFLRCEDTRLRRMWIFFCVFYLFHGLAEPNLFGAGSDAFFWLMIGFSNGLQRNYRNTQLMAER